MIGDFAPVERRNAAHGVDYMLVEAREESKSVFAGQSVLDGMPTPVSAVSCPLVPAPSSITGMLRALPPGTVAALEDDDLEAALDQLVRGAHAGDAAAQQR